MLKPIIAAYEELAVGIADEYTDIQSFFEIVNGYVEEVDKYRDEINRIGETESMMMLDRFEAIYVDINDHLENLSVKIRRILSSNNIQKFNELREIGNEAMFVKQRLSEHVNVDESRFNVSPSVTGIHFTEIMFNHKRICVDMTPIENPGEYGLMSIIDNWTPNVTAYVDSMYQILNIIYNARMEALQTVLVEIKTIFDDFNRLHYKQVPEQMLTITMKALRLLQSPYYIINMYPVIQNSTKNLQIVNQAINYYLDNDNIGYGF